MERVKVKYSEEPPHRRGSIWVTNIRWALQPVWFIGTPLFKEISCGFRLCGSGCYPCKPWFFGNYSDAHFDIAAALRFFDLKPADIDQLQLSMDGTKVSEAPSIWCAADFPGLLERVELAYDVLLNAPFKNHLVARFKKTERWHTIFEGSIPLT